MSEPVRVGASEWLFCLAEFSCSLLISGVFVQIPGTYEGSSSSIVVVARATGRARDVERDV